jgi:hypothetical protein
LRITGPQGGRESSDATEKTRELRAAVGQSQRSRGKR